MSKDVAMMVRPLSGEAAVHRQQTRWLHLTSDYMTYSCVGASRTILSEAAGCILMLKAGSRAPSLLAHCLEDRVEHPQRVRIMAPFAPSASTVGFFRQCALLYDRFLTYQISFCLRPLSPGARTTHATHHLGDTKMGWRGCRPPLYFRSIFVSSLFCRWLRAVSAASLSPWRLTRIYSSSSISSLTIPA